MRLEEEVRKKIKDVFVKTASIRGTARALRISRNAVRRDLRRLDLPIPTAPIHWPRPGKLDPYKTKIRYLVCEKHLSAIRILEEIKELGYQGGYSILKDYIRTFRPKPMRPPTTPIDHKPAQEAQMDWSPHTVSLGGREQIVHTASITLCFSRLLFIRFFPDQTLKRVILLHEEAFKEWGAVPVTITYDNMTTVGRHIGPGKIWINPTFQSFADDYDFKVIILPPGAKDRHGLVERPFHYIEHNFLEGREFSDLEDLNRRGDIWRAKTANVRIHGTLRERPLDRFHRERPFLKPLPHSKSESFFREVERVVHRDFSVAINTNHYSVSPNLIGQRAIVRLYPDHLQIWVNSQLDCKHTYCQSRYQRQVLPEHEKTFKYLTHQHRLLEKIFLRLGEPAKIYYEGLKKQRGAAAGYHLQRILRLVDRHGSDVVAGALAHAARYGAYSADAVTRVIQGKKLKRQGRLMAAPEQIPDNIRQWLRSCAVEEHKLDLYDKLIEQIHSEEDEEDES